MTISNTTVDTFTLGDTDVIRVIEWLGPITSVSNLFPSTPGHVWDDHAGWLDPHFYDKASGAYRAAIQTWVVRTRGMTVLVDTGVGNDRDRPQIPLFDHLNTDFPSRLAAAGITPHDVDVVVNTHIHYDHVGWNTHRVGEKAATDSGSSRDRWEPTFPNATYLVPRADYDYFHPDNAAKMRPAHTEDERRRFDGIRLVFSDSIAPIEAAAQLNTWSGERRLGDNLVLHEAPGHTPGSSVLWLEDGPGAVFVGDLLHTPIQILRPDDDCSFDLDPDQARLSRRRILAQA
ncbi:MAG: MBL fold metallo-hydrolase, partial [Nocardioidaceae bacterium]